MYDNVSKFITTDLTSEHPSATLWLINFPAQSKQAGLNIPAHHYFNIDSGNNQYTAFGVERFDRIGSL